jgi:hypothetical protein
VCTYGLKRMALLLTFWVAVQSQALRAQSPPYITGNIVSGTNLIVTSNTDIYGDTLSMGSQVGTSNTPGWETLYVDGTNSAIYFQAARSGNKWYWQQNGNTSLKTQMTLDSSGNLVLYSNGTNEITLSPAPTGTSTFSGSVIINGTNNTMPSQSLTGSTNSSILTEGMADSRYGLASTVSSLYSTVGLLGFTFDANNYGGNPDNGFGLFGGVTNSGTLAIGPNTSASGYYAVAMGSAAGANGNFSVAIGLDSQSGASAVAIGQSNSAYGGSAVAIGSSNNADGNYSIALGNGNTASGNSSVALGESNTASGNYSVALGQSVANGDYSMAIGNQTTAQAYDSFVIGTYNVGKNITGGASEAHYWSTNDPIFEIGNGSTSTNTSDALAVYKNGNAAVQGTFSAGGTISTTNAISAGSISTSSNIVANGVISCLPGGDLSMGSFTGGTPP